jgi:hypothetical protein
LQRQACPACIEPLNRAAYPVNRRFPIVPNQLIPIFEFREMRIALSGDLSLRSMFASRRLKRVRVNKPGMRLVRN